MLPATQRDSISAIACSSDGGFVAIAGDDGENCPATIRVWALGAEQKPGFSETAGCSVLLGHDKKIDALTWSPNGQQLAGTYAGKMVRVWDVETCERVRELAGDDGEIVHVAWSPTGDRLATVGKSLIVWDAAKGERLTTVKLESDPLGVAWNADGRHLAVALPTAVDLYSAADGTLADTLAVTGKIAQAKLTITSDGHYRAVGPIADQLVYVTLTDDYRQETYTPAAFAEEYGWKN